MKTNYSLLIFNFVISIFMLLSLNSFSTSTMYLPALFLYFSSSIATFIDKYIYYRDLDFFTEKQFSLFCLIVSVAMICTYLSDSLGFVKITFQNVCGTYHMLIQGVPNSFFTFNSINITYPTLFASALLPISYLFFCISAHLREKGFTKDKIKSIVCKNKLKTFLVFIASIVSGLIGMQHCYYKFQHKYEGFGEPQYPKYFIAFWLLFILIFSSLFCTLYKDKQDEISTS